MSWRKRATLCGLRERPRARGPRHSPGPGQAAGLRAVTIARTSPGRPPSPHRPHVRPPHPCEQPWLRERQTQRHAGRRPGAAEAAVSRPGSRSQPPPPRSPCGISWCAAHPGSVLQARSQEPPHTHAHTGRRTFTSTHLHTPNTTHTCVHTCTHRTPDTYTYVRVHTKCHTHSCMHVCTPLHTPHTTHTHRAHNTLTTHTCIHTRTHHTTHHTHTHVRTHLHTPNATHTCN